jgi:hypothetical protein
VVSPPAQQLIKNFGVEQYGTPVFYADALPEPAAEPTEPPKKAKGRRGR